MVFLVVHVDIDTCMCAHTMFNQFTHSITGHLDGSWSYVSAFPVRKLASER